MLLLNVKRPFLALFSVIGGIGLLLSVPSWADVSTTSSEPKAYRAVESPSCRTLELYRPLSVYRDPTTFLPLFVELTSDAGYHGRHFWDQVRQNPPLIRKLKPGTHCLSLGREVRFKQWDVIAEIYEMAGGLKTPSRSKHGILIRSVTLRDGTYGFVEAQAFKQAQLRPTPTGFSRPPSVTEEDLR